MQTKPMTQLVQLVPTDVFYAFLLAQLGKNHLPRRELLNTDTSLYRIPYFDSLDSTLDYLEEKVNDLFSNELKRWLGNDFSHKITQSFADFSVFFKIQLHSYVYASQPLSKSVMALGVKPSTGFVHELCKRQHLEPTQQLKQAINENHTIVLLDKSLLDSVKHYVEENYELLISLEKNRLELLELDEELAKKPYLFTFSLHQHVSDCALDDRDYTSLYRNKRSLDLMFDKG